MADSFEALAELQEGGNLQMFSRDAMLGALKHMVPGTYVVSVKKLREKRSDRQNRYWHGCVIPLFASHCGNSEDDMKDILALALLPKEIVDIITGEVRIVPGHTSELNTKEFNDLIERAQMLGARLDLYVPDPGEAGYDVRQAKVTHYTTADSLPDRRGNNKAVCGARVNERKGETDNKPTCPKCRAWVDRRDSEPVPEWASGATV